MSRYLLNYILVPLILLVLSCGQGSDSITGSSHVMIETDSGLKYIDYIVGSGASPNPGNIITVSYTCWLEDGTEVEYVSVEKPRKFTIGVDALIKGWQEGVISMRAGGVRKMIIPPELAYGEHGLPDRIPPNATLVFVVYLIAVK